MTEIKHLRVVSAPGPTPTNGTVPPRRVPNAALRGREHLTPGEILLLLKVAKARGRYGHRDSTMLRLTERHGLRVRELVELRWDQVSLDEGHLFVRRRKNGRPSTHTLDGEEIRALRRLKREQGPTAAPFVFTTERGGPFTTAAVRKLVTRIGQAAGFAFPLHPHMLRHACGFRLANEGRDTRAIQDFLGHRSIAHTVRYTALAAERFKGF